MIPFILAAVGGYLIADSMKSSKKFADGGMTDFGYHNINKEVTLKNGKKVFITKGRYYWSNELGDARPSGVYYMTKDQDLISDSEISFPLEFAKGGMTEHGLQSGDKIIDTTYYDENTINVINDGKYAAVDLDKGERIEGIYANGGEIEKAAKFRADNPNWTNEKILAEYNDYKFKLSEFNAGNIKPSKVIGGGYKSSAIARKLAKQWLEDRVAENKMALEIRGVMANGGFLNVQKSRRFTEGDFRKLTQEDFYGSWNSEKAEPNRFYLVKKEKDNKPVAKFYPYKELLVITKDADLLSWLKENSYLMSSEYADGGITIYGNKAELPLSNHQMKNYVIDKTGISSGTYINGKYYDSWDKIATDLGFIKDENGWVKAFPSRIYTKKMARGGESHSDQMIDVMNRDREQEMGRRMKFQESTLQEDMDEAKEIFGKYWDTLTEKEKIEATKYLKIKGEVGHFGQEDDDVQTFMNDLNYKRGGRTNE